MKTSGRILSIDWGSVNIGLALSDPTRTIAHPFQVLPHISRISDAARIIEIAVDKEVKLLLIGVSYDDEGNVNPAGRRADRLAAAIEAKTTIPLVRVDEGFSTNEAKRVTFEIGKRKEERKGHQDAIAAALILEHYLENHTNEE